MPGAPLVREKKLIVLKLSGSLFFSQEFDQIVRSLKEVLRQKKNLRIVLVAGGGQTARDYIGVASKLGADQSSLDELGIKVSQLNALVLSKALGNLAANFVPATLEQLVETFEIASSKKQVIVLGGLHPGQSTNAVGALVCEKLGADLFLNATDVDGVYSKDPRKFTDARRLSGVTPRQLTKILSSESMKAGGYDLMDPIALKLIERSKISTRIIKCDSRTIRETLMGRWNVGTKIILN
jgi:uridylate kinase